MKVDYSSIELDGIDSSDYPDFVDAYISNGYTICGMKLTDEQLDDLNNDRDLVYSLVLNYLY